MRRLLLAALLTLGLSAPATASLPVGAKAPDFTTNGAIDGRPFRLHLADQLKNGPVVLYFYPKAFTEGCTFEAKAFSDAADDFRRAGARVIGMSGDDLTTLQRFSREACRGKFPVATASPDVIRAYDVKLPVVERSNRTSYVIAPDGRIVFVHSDMSWKDHVTKTLAAVRALRR